MTAKQYLSQLRGIKVKLWTLYEEIQKQRARLESVTVPLRPDKIQSSGKNDSMADEIAALVDKEVLYADRIYYYERLRTEIVDRILAMENPTYSQLLYKIYVEQKSRQAVASELFYSEAYVSVLHTKALRAFGETHPDIINI